MNRRRLLVTVALAAVLCAVTIGPWADWLGPDLGPNDEAQPISWPVSTSSDIEAVIPLPNEDELPIALLGEGPLNSTPVDDAAEAEETKGSNVALDGRARHSVRIVDAGGRPVPSALIEIWSSLSNLRSGDTGPTGAWYSDGVGLVDVSPLHLDDVLVASHPEFGTSGAFTAQRLADERAQSGEVLIRLLRTVSVDGVVEWPDGTPAAMATIHVDQIGSLSRGRGLSVQPTRFLADLDGRFSLMAEPNGLRLWAEAQEHGHLSERRMVSERITLESNPGSEVSVRLRLPQDWSIRGTVLRSDGQPAPFADVLYHRQEGADTMTEGAEGLLPVLSVQADSQGEYFVRLESPGSYLLAARERGGGLSAIEGIVVGELPSSAHADLVMMIPSEITGRVLGPSGEPIQNVSVLAYPKHGYSADEHLDRSLGLLLSSSSRHDGSFSLSPALEGVAYRLAASMAPEAPELESGLSVVGGMSDVVYRLQSVALLNGRGRISGRVVDAQALPIHDVQLDLLIQSESGRRAVLDVARSDASGEFIVDALRLKEVVALRAMRSGYASVQSDWISVVEDGVDVRLVLEALGGLRVLLRGSSGTEQVGVVYTSKAEGDGASGGTRYDMKLDEWHVLDGFEPGDYLIGGKYLDGPWGESIRVRVMPGEISSIEVQPGERD